MYLLLRRKLGKPQPHQDKMLENERWSDGLQVTVAKGSHQNFIPQSKFNFHCKLKASTVHHGQINSGVFKTFLLRCNSPSRA
jgi:hypothetical protein